MYFVGIRPRPVVDGASGLFVILRDGGNIVGDLFRRWYRPDDPEMVVAWWVINLLFCCIDGDSVVVACALFVDQIAHPLS